MDEHAAQVIWLQMDSSEKTLRTQLGNIQINLLGPHSEVCGHILTTVGTSCATTEGRPSHLTHVILKHKTYRSQRTSFFVFVLIFAEAVNVNCSVISKLWLDNKALEGGETFWWWNDDLLFDNEQTIYSICRLFFTFLLRRAKVSICVLLVRDAVALSSTIITKL